MSGEYKQLAEYLWVRANGADQADVIEEEIADALDAAKLAGDVEGYERGRRDAFEASTADLRSEYERGKREELAYQTQRWSSLIDGVEKHAAGMNDGPFVYGMETACEEIRARAGLTPARNLMPAADDVIESGMLRRDRAQRD